jgi:flagellar secretion chaperone FliS
MNDYASAKQAYTASSVMTAPPQQLVVMLYDGAIRFLRQAATGMRAGNREVALNRLQRAEAIVDELNVSLDMSQGEIAGRLRAIYLFSKRHLNEALIERDAGKVDQVVVLLADLREAWQEIAAAMPSQDDSAAAQ